MRNFISYLLNINLQIPNKNFFEKSVFEPGLLFLQDRGLFFELVISPCFFVKPLYQNVRIDHRIIFTCWSNR